MAENLFGAEVPATVSHNDNSPYTLGTRFTPAVSGTVTHIRWYVPTNPPTGTTTFLLFRNSDEAQIGSATQSLAGLGAQWVQVAFAAPVAVTAGQSYTAAVFIADHYVSTTPYSWPKSNGANLSTPSPGGYFNGNFSASYPNATFNNGNYFADVVFEPAGGALTRTVDDTAGLADAVVVVVAHARTATDNTAFSDATTRVAGHARIQTDGAGLTDSNVRAAASARSATDGAGLTDAVVPQLAGDITRTADDSAGLADAIAVARQASATDPAGLTDAVALARTATVADSTGFTDSLALAAAVTATDSTGLTDTASVQLAAAGARQVDDNTGLADALALARTVSVADAPGLADTLAVVSAFIRLTTDALGLTDALSIAAARAVSLTDRAGFTDSTLADLSTGGALVRTITDSVGLDSTIRTIRMTRRPSAGTTTRLNSGTTARPSSGVTPRYALVSD